ncbi:hypothetical protein [Spartinivicinus ruber]|uniref:hypothetical protein n=1 Tax=Spartinivicinus ruber TaxID=2683272 RepID=UPI0013D846B7|nr:hypothetical protein [Spartinivicinus ruber]
MAHYQPLLSLMISHEYYQGVIPSQFIDYKVHESSIRLLRNLNLLSQLTHNGIELLYDSSSEQLENLSDYLSLNPKNQEAVAEDQLIILIKITNDAFFYCTPINLVPSEKVFYFEDVALLKKQKVDETAYISRDAHRAASVLSSNMVVSHCQNILIILNINLWHWLRQVLSQHAQYEPATLYLDFATQAYHWLYSIWVGERLFNEIVDSNGKAELLFIEPLSVKKSEDFVFTQVKTDQRNSNQFVIRFISAQAITCLNRQALKLRLKKRTGVSTKTLVESLPHPEYRHQEKLTIDGKAATVLSVHMKL